MATTREIYNTVERWQASLANRFGTDLDTAPVALRALAHADAALFAVLATTLINEGIVSGEDFVNTWLEAHADVGWVPDA